MELPSRGRLTAAFAALIIGRVVYAFNWYDVGPIQPKLATIFTVPLSDLSFSLWAFLIAVGIFQVPAGVLALRIGARKTSLLGLAVLGLGATGSALVTSLWIFVALRFVVGIGAALFFSPAMGLIAQYYEGQRRGIAFGLFNAAFNLGAGSAVFLTVYLANSIGAGPAILVGGLAMLAATVLNLAILPEIEERKEPSRRGAIVRQVLGSRFLWIFAASLMGFWAANFAVAQFFVTYAESVRQLSSSLAAVMDAVIVMSAMAGGPLGGYLGSMVKDGRGLLAAIAGAIAILTASIAFVATWFLWPLALLLGVLSGLLFGAMYLLPTRIKEFARETAPLSLGLLNGIQVLGGSFIVLSAGYFLYGKGLYTELWTFLAIICVLPLVLMAALGNQLSRGKDVR